MQHRISAGMLVALDGRLLLVRHFKPREYDFWVAPVVVFKGELSIAAPEATSEFIVEAAWLSRSELQGRIVFPPVLSGRYWQDREFGELLPVRLPLRHMEFC